MRYTQSMDLRAPTTVGGLLTLGRLRLRNSESARLDCELLLSHVLNCQRSNLLTRREQAMTPPACAAFLSMLEDRERGVPVAYLLGHREFWSLTLRVSCDTLIPRPETELLVELALQLIPAKRDARVADLGTGTGAIALAIASKRPNWSVVATDLSEAALHVARGNAKLFALDNVEFRHGDWLTPLSGERVDLIVSNPPYVAANDPHLQQGDVRFEPPLALVGGEDGLHAIRHIVALAGPCLRDDGWLLLEHGATHGEAVRELFGAHGFEAVATHRDLASLERGSVGRKRPEHA